MFITPQFFYKKFYHPCINVPRLESYRLDLGKSQFLLITPAYEFPYQPSPLNPGVGG